MNEFEGIRTRRNNDNEFANIRTKPKASSVEDELVAKNTGDDWLPFLSKSALKHATSLADIPKLAGNIIEGSNNLRKKYITNPLLKKLGGFEEQETNYSDYIPDTSDVRQLIKEKNRYRLRTPSFIWYSKNN